MLKPKDIPSKIAKISGFSYIKNKLKETLEGDLEYIIYKKLRKFIKNSKRFTSSKKHKIILELTKNIEAIIDYILDNKKDLGELSLALKIEVAYFKKQLEQKFERKIKELILEKEVIKKEIQQQTQIFLKEIENKPDKEIILLMEEETIKEIDEYIDEIKQLDLHTFLYLVYIEKEFNIDL